MDSLQGYYFLNTQDPYFTNNSSNMLVGMNPNYDANPMLSQNQTLRDGTLSEKISDDAVFVNFKQLDRIFKRRIQKTKQSQLKGRMKKGFRPLQRRARDHFDLRGDTSAAMLQRTAGIPHSFAAPSHDGSGNMYVYGDVSGLSGHMPVFSNGVPNSGVKDTRHMNNSHLNTTAYSPLFTTHQRSHQHNSNVSQSMAASVSHSGAPGVPPTIPAYAGYSQVYAHPGQLGQVSGYHGGMAQGHPHSQPSVSKMATMQDMKQSSDLAQQVMNEKQVAQSKK